jgi:hypothetical protein
MNDQSNPTVSNQQPQAVYSVNVPRLIGLTIIYLGLLVLYYWGWIARWGFVATDIILILVLLGLAGFRVASLYLNKNLSVLVFDDRLVYSNKEQTQVFFWQNVDKVWTFRYDMLSLIYVRYVRVTIEDKFGNKIVLDRNLGKIKELEKTVQARVMETKLTAVLDSLENGETFQSGGFSLTKEYLEFKNTRIPWDKLGKVIFYQGQIRIWEKGKRIIKIAQWGRNIPNLYLFLTILDKMAGKHLMPIDPSQTLDSQNLEG